MVPLVQRRRPRIATFATRLAWTTEPRLKFFPPMGQKVQLTDTAAHEFENWKQCRGQKQITADGLSEHHWMAKVAISGPKWPKTGHHGRFCRSNRCWIAAVITWPVKTCYARRPRSAELCSPIVSTSLSTDYRAVHHPQLSRFDGVNLVPVGEPALLDDDAWRCLEGADRWCRILRRTLPPD